jgi:hypothetical protein
MRTTGNKEVSRERKYILAFILLKVQKCKFNPRTSHEDPEGE